MSQTTLLILCKHTRQAHPTGSGFSQNRSKQESVCSLRNVQENRLLSQADGLGNMLTSLKHVGAYYQPNDFNSVERVERVRAIKSGWVSLLGFWHSRAPKKLKREVSPVGVLESKLKTLESKLKS